MIELDRHDLRNALQQHQAQLVQRGQALSFVTALPCLAESTEAITATAMEPAPPPEPEPAPVPPTATHLLRGTKAVSLATDGTDVGNGWQLVAAERAWQLRGEGAAPQVNGAQYSPGRMLGAGDRLSVDGDTDALLIEVEA